MDTKEVKNVEKSTKRKKGLLRKLINFKSVIIICIILVAISVYQLLVHERFSFTINTLSSYSVNADVEFDVIVNDLVMHTIIIQKNLYMIRLLIN